MGYSEDMTEKKKRSIYLSILMLVLGLALAAFIRSLLVGRSSINDLVSAYQETVLEYEALQAQNQRLIEQNDLLESKIALLISNLDGDESYEEVIKEREYYALISGMAAVEGSGIRVTLNDRLEYDPARHPIEAIVHDKTVLHVIDILKAKGAQAIAFNGTRLTAVAQIGCIGPTILCYNNRQMPPYVIEAIGPMEEMASAIAGDAYLNHITSSEVGIRMSINLVENLALPSFSRTGDYRTLITLLEAR
ncbi:MAG: DUF881 domain-containing protein [Clostridiaceae bacterium]|jgi:uncharacterized protein YlxW (UPF0749 family)|nr:DUF881 domain-containing protein [Clostridiaceae bacterium]